MTLNAVAITNRALIKIGANTITTFTDGTAEAEVANLLYPTVKTALLSAHPWTFATGQITLNQLSINPLADYDFSYQLPNDFLRALSLGDISDSALANYRIHGSTIHTNIPNAVLSYIFEIDESIFPPFFGQAMIARLSAEFCMPLTENTSRTEFLFRLAEAEFRNAKQVDSQQDTPSRLDHFTLIEARS